MNQDNAWLKKLKTGEDVDPAVKQVPKRKRPVSARQVRALAGTAPSKPKLPVSNTQRRGIGG